MHRNLVFIMFVALLFGANGFGQTSQNVEQLAVIDTLGYVGEVQYSDNMLFVARSEGLLTLFDVSDPARLSLVSSVDLGGSISAIAVQNSLVYFVTDSSFIILDISDPASLTEIGRIHFDELVFGLAVKDTLAYIVMLEAGVIILDVSDPTAPEEVGSIWVEGNGMYVHCVNDLLLVFAAWIRKICIYDNLDPLSPRMIGSITNASSGGKLSYSHETLYLTNLSHGLNIFDISDPTQPERLGSFDTDGFVADVKVRDNIAYIADGNFGLRVLDVSRPDSCSEIGYYNTPGSTEWLALGDNGIVFVSDRSSLRICRYTPDADVSDSTLQPSAFDLQLYPNPFNSTARVSFSLPSAGRVKVLALDASGRVVVHLAEGYYPAGAHSIMWEPGMLPNGAYMLKGEMGGESLVRKAVLVK